MHLVTSKSIAMHLVTSMAMGYGGSYIALELLKLFYGEKR
jgi:hypothetical protein